MTIVTLLLGDNMDGWPVSRVCFAPELKVDTIHSKYSIEQIFDIIITQLISNLKFNFKSSS